MNGTCWTHAPCSARAASDMSGTWAAMLNNHTWSSLWLHTLARALAHTLWAHTLGVCADVGMRGDRVPMRRQRNRKWGV
eukprot:361102-Chlamydomonas_euryale.AAC.1